MIRDSSLRCRLINQKSCIIILEVSGMKPCTHRILYFACLRKILQIRIPDKVEMQSQRQTCDGMNP